MIMRPPLSFEQKNKVMFGRWAKFYDSRFLRQLYFERLYRKLMMISDGFHLYPWPPSFRVLDVACGTGELLFRLASKAPQADYAGLDLTPEMLAVARKKLAAFRHVKLVEGNASALPFKDRSFDLVLCSEAFHHFFEPQIALNEMARVTKPGGYLILMDPAANTFFQRLVVRFGSRLIEVNNHVYSFLELQALLRNAGYTVEQHFYYFLNNFIVARRA